MLKHIINARPLVNSLNKIHIHLDHIYRSAWINTPTLQRHTHIYDRIVYLLFVQKFP